MLRELRCAQLRVIVGQCSIGKGQTTSSIAQWRTTLPAASTSRPGPALAALVTVSTLAAEPHVGHLCPVKRPMVLVSIFCRSFLPEEATDAEQKCQGAHLKIVQLLRDFLPCLPHKQVLALQDRCLKLLKAKQPRDSLELVEQPLAQSVLLWAKVPGACLVQSILYVIDLQATDMRQQTHRTAKARSERKT